MMKPCKQCLENKWTFKVIDGFVQASCVFCGFEVVFPKRQKKREYKWSKQQKPIDLTKATLRYYKNGAIKVIPHGEEKQGTLL